MGLNCQLYRFEPVLCNSRFVYDELNFKILDSQKPLFHQINQPKKIKCLLLVIANYLQLHDLA
jgi:hypothetical protein